MLFALFRAFDRKMDYVHSCVTKRIFDSTKVFHLSIDFNRCFCNIAVLIVKKITFPFI